MGSMKKYGKGAYRRWVFPVLAVLLLAIIFIVWQRKRQETGYSIIQAVIEEIPDYQDDIESWGYRVSVLLKMTGEPDNAGLMRYYLESAGPVLILEDQDGGMYCFYHGFDQYISERTCKENMMLILASQYAEKEYEDVLKTVRLQLCKRNMKREPLHENTADADSKDYYDVSVLIEITAESLADGKEVSVLGGGYFATNYCSNNFEECRLWNGIDPARRTTIPIIISSRNTVRRSCWNITGRGWNCRIDLQNCITKGRKNSFVWAGVQSGGRSGIFAFHGLYGFYDADVLPCEDQPVQFEKES